MLVGISVNDQDQIVLTMDAETAACVHDALVDALGKASNQIPELDHYRYVISQAEQELAEAIVHRVTPI